MRSRTSFFNRTVFLHDVKRFWPLTALYTLLWFLILPLSRLTELNHDAYLSAWNARYETLEIAALGGYWSAFLTGILFAMAAFSYLTNSRATYGLHALPARRETLYVTHYLAGLCSQLAPQLLTVALTMAVLASHGAFDLRVTGLMLLSFILPTLFFYSFGVLCMVFIGQILAAPVFYGVLNVLAVGVELLIRTFAGDFLYGWASDMAPVLTAFSPIVKLVQIDLRAVGTGNEYYDTGAVSGVRMTGELIIRGMEWLLLYAAVGVVLAALGLLVYRRRHSEATGSIVAVYWARPVFQYGVAFCAALAIGQLVYYVFFGQYRGNGDYSLAGMLACMAAAGLIGYFIAEMLLKKSVRVWRSGWRGAVTVTAALVLLGVGMTFDLTGYEGYVPALESVESVSVSIDIYEGDHPCHISTDSKDTIRLAAAAHRAIINDKARQQNDRSRWQETFTERDDVTGGYFNIDYCLSNGEFVRRRYSMLTLFEAELDDPASPAAAITALYNDPDVMVMRALGRYGYFTERDPRKLDDLRFTGGYYSRADWKNDVYYGETERDLSPGEARLVYDAVLRDAAAGRVSESLFDERAQTIDATLALYATYLDTRDDRGTAEPTASGEDGRSQITFELAVTPRMSETLAELRAMGVEIPSE